MTNTSSNNHFAALASDGTRQVVWGVGATEEAAEADGRRWLAECQDGEHVGEELEIVAISEAQAARIAAGEVVWPVRAAPAAVRATYYVWGRGPAGLTAELGATHTDWTRGDPAGLPDRVRDLTVRVSSTA